jgi:hypothetical protein
MSNRENCPACPAPLGQRNPTPPKQNPLCPAVPCIRGWDSGTVDTERDNPWDKPGTVSLKDLARAALAVPDEWDKTGQGGTAIGTKIPAELEAATPSELKPFPCPDHGQGCLSCPDANLGRLDFCGKHGRQGEKAGAAEPPAAPPDPSALAHAKRMLIYCPALGEKLHCWRCSRCYGAESGGCKAWHSRRSDVEFFRRSGPPYSLFLAESPEGVLQ